MVDDHTEDYAKSILYHMDEIWHWCKVSSTMKIVNKDELTIIYVLWHVNMKFLTIWANVDDATYNMNEVVLMG
jgi:hypothetical protein